MEFCDDVTYIYLAVLEFDLDNHLAVHSHCLHFVLYLLDRSTHEHNFVNKEETARDCRKSVDMQCHMFCRPYPVSTLVVDLMDLSGLRV